MNAQNLLLILNEATSIAKKNKLPIVTGTLQYDDERIMKVEADYTSLEDFFSIAIKMGAPFIYLNYSSEDSENLMNIVDLEVGFMTPNGSMYFSIFLETPENKQEREEDDNDDDYGDEWPEDIRISDSDMREGGASFEKYKVIIANDPKFQAAVNQPSRLLITKRVLKDGGVLFDSRSAYYLCEAATTLFKVDIQPVLEEQLADKIQSMLESGISKAKIAKELKITLSRLNKLI